MTNDILMCADNNEYSILVWWHLWAGFNTILIDHLVTWVGICWTAPKWFASYLSNTQFHVHINNYKCSSAPLLCDVHKDQFWVPFSFGCICCLSLFCFSLPSKPFAPSTLMTHSCIFPHFPHVLSPHLHQICVH